MNLYLLLVTLTLVNAGVVPDTECNGVIFDGNCYEKEILKTDLILPSNLAVDFNANILYFSYYNVNAISALIDLNTKEFKDIDDVPDGTTQTVDQNSHDVYIGGNDGIYKYDPKNHKSELYAAEGKHISRIFLKDVLYFSQNSYGSMYTYIDGNIEQSKDLEDIKTSGFVIDGEDVLLYTNDTGLYVQKKGSKNTVLYSDKIIVTALTVDVHGNAYMCDEKAIYKFDKKSLSLKKKMDVDKCSGLAFDSNDNVIYATYHDIIYLKNNSDKTCSIFSLFVVLMLGLSHLAL